MKEKLLKDDFKADFVYLQAKRYTYNTVISGKTGGPGGKPRNDQHIEGHEAIEKNYDYHIGSHLQKKSKE